MHSVFGDLKYVKRLCNLILKNNIFVLFTSPLLFLLQVQALKVQLLSTPFSLALIWPLFC